MAEPVTGPADIIIVNATILPMGGGATVQNGVLKICGDRITELGPAGLRQLSHPHRFEHAVARSA